MKAIMLAAGVGSRLDARGAHPPKVLVDMGGKSLLRRHVEILAHCGIEELVLVVGYKAEMIADEVARIERDQDRPGFVRLLPNPDFERGSVLSLWAARAALDGDEPVLVMDADVLYDHRMLRALVESRHVNCFLMDRDLEPGEEPVKLCVRDGRLVEFRKRVEGEYDLRGESVGFFRFAADVVDRLFDTARAYIEDGRVEEPFEEVLRDVLRAGPAAAFGWEDVTGLPWIEIDFPDDVARARESVLPRLTEPPG